MKHNQFFRKSNAIKFLFFLLTISWNFPVFGQQIEELNTGWYCKNIEEVPLSGNELTSVENVDFSTWLPATVPGTVLTSLLNNGKIPDPFYGMNNEDIPDIYGTGRDHYTYWFYNEIDVKSIKDDQFWLIFRGINYACDIFLNGKKINPKTHYGMFLRQKYNITSGLLEGKNKLAVLVYPPDPVGNPNGGQGGDGEIAKNVMHQYVAGWDWIQPVRDRNTGIWDKVFIERTGEVDIKNTHVITRVPGKRIPKGDQAPAKILISTELINTGNRAIQGQLIFHLEGKEVIESITLLPNSLTTSKTQEITIQNPNLWWPNGYGDQTLYDLEIQFLSKKTISDTEKVRFGVREIQTSWNPFTKSREIQVNGQKIFIKGGNWIISDAMLRFSKKRYDAEIRMHKDMNLNTIRIWGGAITERPEFYEACDKYGLLVMQDLWISGDCNGRWLDPKKKDDQWTRRAYPNDPNLFLSSAADQIKMLRNHPSLAFWCGGNELGPPENILIPLKDSLATLDGTRWFADYSTSDSLSFNSLGGNGDGPYGIQQISTFFEHHTFPFNSEVGSIGLPDYEGLHRYLPDSVMIIPGQYHAAELAGDQRQSTIHPQWRYHKYLPYGDFISKYGETEDIQDYAFKAQLVNYDQYRGLIEGFSSHMWEWYTGVIIWKTQNPWTSMRGQMYDYYLDQNAGLYGLRHGSEQLHVLLDPVKNQVMIANNTFKNQNDLMLEVDIFDMAGNKTLIYQEIVSIIPTTSKRYGSIGRRLTEATKEDGAFVQMKLYDQYKNLIDENFYWLPNEQGEYSGLQKMKNIQLEVSATQVDQDRIEVKLINPHPDNPISFFNRISVIDSKTKQRVLPVFYSDNYITVEPNGEKSITIDNCAPHEISGLKINVQGWNMKPLEVEIKQN